MADTCETCRFWEFLRERTSSPSSIGRCKRNPPMLDGNTGWGIFPKMLNAEHCFEHQPKQDRG